jgi:hypothetical protein
MRTSSAPSAGLRPLLSRTISDTISDESPGAARRLTFIIVALVWLTACSPALDWRLFSWPAGGFAALMPAKPSEETREIFIGATRLDMHLFSASAAGNAYAAGYADLPPALDSHARERLLQDAQAGFAHNVGATPGSFEENSIEGFPCRQFTIAGNASGRSVEVAGRVCTTDRRFYQLVYLGPAENARNADVPLFLASLKLLF